MKRILLAAVWSLAAVAAHGEYTLKVSNGKWPEGVTAKNINGNVPIESGYKNGWTDQGWTIGDYGNIRNVLLSPSYLAEGETCESALTLPLVTIEPEEWLFWKSCAVYPVRNELHTVEIRRKGEEQWTLLAEVYDSAGGWTQHMANLAGFDSTECEVRFVCGSKNGYMLALDGINISVPADFSFEASSGSSKFFGLDDVVEGCVPIDFSVRNLGKSIAGVTVALTVGGASVAEYEADWNVGEEKSFSLPLPIALNERADYKIVVKNVEGSEQTIAESFAFLSSIKKYMLVDKGTGMWCNSCPVGTLEIDELERTYGESLIAIETHNGDLLANDVYFNWLGYRSIPRLELDRNKSTSGESSKYFKDYICLPTEMGITLTGISPNPDGSLNVSAEVSTSEMFDDSDRTYRIGYVITRDVEGNEDMHYYQSNNCVIPYYCQYFYLPSTIMAPLCRFPNTSLPSPLASNSDDVAFTGIAGSLPESLDASQIYSVNWNVPLPTGYEDFQGMRIVAYILDAGSRKVVNSTVAYIDDVSGVAPIRLDDAISGSGLIYSVDGKSFGKSKDGLAPGIYIINGKKVKL